MKLAANNSLLVNNKFITMFNILHIQNTRVYKIMHRMHTHAQHPTHVYMQSNGARVFWQLVSAFGTCVMCVCTARPTRVVGVHACHTHAPFKL